MVAAALASDVGADLDLALGVASMVGCFLIVRWRSWKAFALGWKAFALGEAVAC